MSTQRKVRKTTTSQSISTGSITLPAEVGEEKMVVEVARKWGADAIRDSDRRQLVSWITRHNWRQIKWVNHQPTL